MNSQESRKLARARKLYHELNLEGACNEYRSIFGGHSIEVCCDSVEDFSLFIRSLYELDYQEELKSYQEKLRAVPEKNRNPNLSYQLALSYLTHDPGSINQAIQCFEKLLFETREPNLVARAKMGLATCHDMQSGDWRVCGSIINSIEGDGLQPYLKDLTEIWRAKIFRDSGQLDEAEKLIGKTLAKIQSHFHWHAYLSAKVILGGIYFKQERFNQLLEVIKEVRSYCDQHPLSTIRRQINYLADQMRGYQTSIPLILEKSERLSVLRYEDRSLVLTGEKPWQKLLSCLIQEKILPKKEIIQKIYNRNYRPKSDDRLIYGHLSVLKKNLLKLGISQKLIAKDSRGYRWIPEVAEIEEKVK